ncbi:uncharacterized protein LOC111738215 [Pteropus vampyrus]|uniref:Uncharacterized protein LOC111738215 n=1 Tax=Pteropus vampyrus TaxID=132908 RepID=A0A6P6CCR2_PTEVA|nr:uncharacterized protein LOC111738215 [Pteropus vampyrus]
MVSDSRDAEGRNSGSEDGAFNPGSALDLPASAQRRVTTTTVPRTWYPSPRQEAAGSTLETQRWRCGADGLGKARTPQAGGASAGAGLGATWRRVLAPASAGSLLPRRGPGYPRSPLPPASPFPVHGAAAFAAEKRKPNPASPPIPHAGILGRTCTPRASGPYPEPGVTGLRTSWMRSLADEETEDWADHTGHLQWGASLPSVKAPTREGVRRRQPRGGAGVRNLMSLIIFQ